MGKKPEEGKVGVSTNSVWARPSEEELHDDYLEQVRINNALSMPDACCKSCGNIFKPWSLDRNMQSWPPYDDVTCPKCGKKVRVFLDKKLERDFSSRKLLEESELGKFQKEFAQFKTEILTRLNVLEKGYETALEAKAKEFEAHIIALLNKMSIDQTSKTEKVSDKKQTGRGIPYQ
jgi:RNase P subunit RPR2